MKSRDSGQWGEGKTRMPVLIISDRVRVGKKIVLSSTDSAFDDEMQVWHAKDFSERVPDPKDLGSMLLSPAYWSGKAWGGGLVDGRMGQDGGVLGTLTALAGGR